MAFAAGQAVIFYTLRYILNSNDPLKSKRQGTKSKSAQILDRLGRNDITLNEYEEIIACEIVLPEEINTTFEDIGGLQHIVSNLKENVIYPLKLPSLFSGSQNLLSPPKGVLLYGPPGCGKTMLAKALAKESNATFINMHVSTLTDKWFGESNKLVAGLFSLAKKCQPSIIFIDEIDSFLRERGRGDHEVTNMMKAEFMTFWDGLSSESNDRILVLGATNRPNDIDQAILRRMPKRYPVKVPNDEQRKNILNLILRDTTLAQYFDVNQLVDITNGLTGSDLHELCRNAAMIPMRELMRKHDPSTLEHDISKIKPRPLTITDFMTASNEDEDDMPTYDPTIDGKIRQIRDNLGGLD
ncbi:AAA-domain-containing protein [Wallemia mellicola]|nr:AAA-domain-containing protein [Wallemia mellicola]TIC51797.1 AAA-domain-containing protein [Wallemia mellicola]